LAAEINSNYYQASDKHHDLRLAPQSLGALLPARRQ
jgi:hypothetical protein